MRIARALGLRLAIVGAAAALLACAPVPSPPQRADAATGAAVAGAAGFVLFASLSRRLRPPSLTDPAVARAVALALPALVAVAVVEETLWRYGALGALGTELGIPSALAISTLGFAFAHAASGWRAVRSHLATGLAFGSVYAVTGRVVDAIVAHLAYNLLVVAASAASRTPARRVSVPST